MSLCLIHTYARAGPMEFLLRVDPRWCVLSVFISSFLTVTLFVIRLTSSSVVFTDHVINGSNFSTEPGLLLVLIHASGYGVKVRNAIRNTWVSPRLFHKLDREVQKRVDYRFVLGAQGLSGGLIADLTEEAGRHGDMILLPDVSDEHKSLSYRTLRSFQHVAQNETMKDFLYVMKCDDDTFVNLLAVTAELSQRDIDAGFFWGQFLGAGGIIKEGPYAEFSWSVCETYLPYALGGGYVLSMDLVKQVAKNAPFLKVYRNEDVSVGAWLAPYNIDFVSDARFNTGAETKGCKRPYIVIHRVNVTQMYNYFDAVLNDGYICNKKNHWFVWHGYRYNWKVKPSRCCKIMRRVP